MRWSTWLILILVVVLRAEAQIRVSPPQARYGDTLYTARDLMPGPLSMSGFGEGLQWDMRGLLSPFVHQVLVRPDGAGDGMIMAGPDDVDRHFVFRTDGLYLHQLRMPPFNGQRTVVRIDPPLPYIRNLQLGHTWSHRCTLSVANKPLAYVVINAVADAAGVLLTSGVNYDVVRERRDIEVIPVEAGTSDPGVSLSALPHFFTFGRQYHFVSSQASVPVAVVFTDALNQARQVEYATHRWAGDIVRQLPTRPDIFVYPNPSFGHVRFDLMNLPAGHYDILIYNILGVLVRSERIHVQGIRTVTMDLSGLRKGTYIYRLVDGQQNTIRSKRLVIISP